MDENTLNEMTADEEVIQPEVEVQAPTEQPEPTGEEVATPPVVEETDHDRRVKGLEAAAAAERRRRQELEHEVQRMQAMIQHGQREPEKPKGPPNPDDFKDWQEYDAARLDYIADQKLNAKLDEMRAQHAEQQRRANQERQQTEFEEKTYAAIARGQAKYPDFDAVINTGLAPFLTPNLRAALVYHEQGDEVGYYLGKNPQEAQRLSSMTPYQQIAEVTRIGITLEQTKATRAPKPTIPTTLSTVRDTRGQFAQQSEPEDSFDFLAR